MRTGEKGLLANENMGVYTSSSLNIDEEQLLNDVCTWHPDQCINWSQLALWYGLNHGHVIKEYLPEQGIKAAQRKQRTERAQRRFLSGG